MRWVYKYPKEDDETKIKLNKSLRREEEPRFRRPLALCSWFEEVDVASLGHVSRSRGLFVTRGPRGQEDKLHRMAAISPARPCICGLVQRLPTPRLTDMTDHRTYLGSFQSNVL